MATKPNVGLIVEITTADGTRYQWGKGSNVPGDVPQNLGFSTRLGDGFADAQVTLNRRIDRDWPDVNLYDDVAFVGYDGSVAYEGRVAANPRSISTVHSMNVVCAGWMAHTRDKKMQEIYVDRDLSRWGPVSIQRRINVAATFALQDASVGPDTTTGNPSLIQSADLSGTAAKPLCEATYSTLGIPIGSLYYAWTKGANVNYTLPAWTWKAILSDGDDSFVGDATANLSAVGPGTGTLSATATTRKFAWVEFYYDALSATADNTAYNLFWTVLAVYGNHGLTKQGTADATNAQGFYASDIIRHVITNFCPQLNASGVQDTTYVIPQAAYTDPTDPFDVIADVNKYHRWQFYVWENKTFTYAPIDLSDYDWQVDYFDPGVTLDLQGDSTDDGAFNGICVNYTDLQTGKPNRLTPDTNTELADTDPENPANRRGIDHWDEISLSSPTTADGAVQIGRAALAEKNTPKGQGTITIKGHIKDRAGHWQQGWKVRAGDRVAIVSSTSLSDRPRLISETNYDHGDGGGTLTISVESPPPRIDAVLDRIQTALAAANLA